MSDYLTELRRVVDRERLVLEAMSNNGCPAHLVKLQRQRFEKLADEEAKLSDYYLVHAVDYA